MDKSSLCSYLAEVRHQISSVVNALGVLQDGTVTLSKGETEKILGLAHMKLEQLIKSLDQAVKGAE